MLTSKGTLRQVLLRVYRLELSIMHVGIFELLPLQPSLWFNSPPSPPSRCELVYCIHRIQCVRGVYGVLGLRQINTCCKVNFFGWQHFPIPLPSMSYLTVRAHWVVYIRGRVIFKVCKLPPPPYYDDLCTGVLFLISQCFLFWRCGKMSFFLVSHLDYFLDSPEEYGYSILRNVSLAYNDTLGKTQYWSGLSFKFQV